MYDATLAETVTIRGDGGDEIEAYLARPMSAGPLGGVVVIHHMPGYDAPTKEIARRFAAEGYNALMPNLYYRDAPGAGPDDAAAAARAKGGVPDDRLVGDVAGTAAHLRALPVLLGQPPRLPPRSRRRRLGQDPHLVRPLPGLLIRLALVRAAGSCRPAAA
jgi:carboxymethylenebutenolidase